MKNLMVAGTIIHAEIMIKWLKLDRKHWVPIRYGDVPKGRYWNAHLVRPTQGVNDEEYAWVQGVLKKAVLGRIIAMPHFLQKPPAAVDAA